MEAALGALEMLVPESLASKSGISPAPIPKPTASEERFSPREKIEAVFGLAFAFPRRSAPALAPAAEPFCMGAAVARGLLL